MTTLSKIQALLAKRFDLDIATLRPERALNELGVDSLAVIEFMFVLEDEFGINIPQDDVALDTIQDVANLIEKLVQKQGGKTAASS